MAISKLSLAKIKAAPAPSFLNDGGGLYLQTEKTGTQSWVFRFKWHGRDRRTGLGGLDTVDPGQAREAARELRQMVAKGIDPVIAKRQERARTQLVNKMTFRKTAEAFIAEHENGWTPSNTHQWRYLFERNVYPQVGDLPIAAVNDRTTLLQVLEPLWQTTPATAGRLRAYVAKVIGWATFHGYCNGDNQARWKDHLEHGLPRPSAIRPVQHYKAMPYREIPQFLIALRRRRGLIALALEFTLFAAGRQIETREAVWREIDLKAGMWVIPAGRLKTRKTRTEPHMVMLTPPMLAILDKLLPLKIDDNSFVFPGRRGALLGAAVMRHLMIEMGYGGFASPHGFRRSFKTWAQEQTRFNRLEVELALAHAIPGVEGIYLDSELLENRALLGQAWADFCLGLTPPKAANVLRLAGSNINNNDEARLAAGPHALVKDAHFTAGGAPSGDRASVDHPPVGR